MKKFWLIFLAVVGVLVVVFEGLYLLAGLRQRIGYTLSLRTIPDIQERAYYDKAIFFGADGKAVGGVVAYKGKQGLWVWGK